MHGIVSQLQATSEKKAYLRNTIIPAAMKYFTHHLQVTAKTHDTRFSPPPLKKRAAPR